MTYAKATARAYSLPFRAVWLRSKDSIDLRFADGAPDGDIWTTADLVAHIADYRLVGVSIQDHKRLGLGRWLRATGADAKFEDSQPLPSGTVRYDQAAQFAYFSIWPLLSDEADMQNYQREGKIHLTRNGEIARIRFQVLNRRGRAGALGVAAGLLATR